jgi:hypothetical protein
MVLAVSHENPIQSARALILGDPEHITRHDGIANCECVELVKSQGGVRFSHPTLFSFIL